MLTAVAATTTRPFQCFDDSADIQVPSKDVRVLSTSTRNVEGCFSDGMDYGINPPVAERFTNSEQALGIAGVANIGSTGGDEFIEI